MDNENQKLEKYRAALDMFKYENQLYWQLFSVFFTIKVALLACLVKEFNSKIVANNLCECDADLLIISIIGFGFLLIWFGILNRQKGYRDLRMTIAKSHEPIDWNILKGYAEDYAHDRQISINGSQRRSGALRS